MSESKARRRLRPVKTASGEILEGTEPTPRKPRWLIVTAVLVVLLVVAAGGLQWRYGWVHGLPHQKSAVASIEVPTQPVAAPIASTASFAPIDPAAVARALAPFLSRSAKAELGPHVDVFVTGLTGAAAFRSGAGPITPASTLKLLAATAALHVLGPSKRFTTSVRRTGPSSITLVGGGDPYLSTKPGAKTAYPQPANLTALARSTAAYLKAHHQRRVALSYDASLFSGPGLDPSWEPDYFSSGVIAPISALWTNEGVLPSGTLSANPALTATQVFAGLLRARGITVTGNQASAHAAASAPTIARVTSAPLVDELAETLGDSDNFAAEVIARQVAVGTGAPATFTGAVDAIETTLRGLGIPLTGLQMHDGSGLSRHDRLQPATLAAILRLAATTPTLSGLITDLPVAGFSGTLAYRFDTTAPRALGLVRAKTGTLTGVSAMAGIAVDSSGTPLIFVAISDRVPVTHTLDARDVLDHIGAALTACACSQH